MKNEPSRKAEPVAYIDPYDLERLPHYDCHIGSQQLKNGISLYTQDQLEEARKLGMQQERALWNLSASTQEIMDTHPVKEQDEPNWKEMYWEMHELNHKHWSELKAHPVKELHLSLQKDKETGELLAVTYTDDEHRIVEVLWQRPPVKELTDEEILGCWVEEFTGNALPSIDFARAILLKAQEK